MGLMGNMVPTQEMHLQLIVAAPDTLTTSRRIQSDPQPELSSGTRPEQRKSLPSAPLPSPMPPFQNPYLITRTLFFFWFPDLSSG